MVVHVMAGCSTHYKSCWYTFKQGNIQMLMVLHNRDCGKVDIITINIMIVLIIPYIASALICSSKILYTVYVKTFSFRGF